MAKSIFAYRCYCSIGKAQLNDKKSALMTNGEKQIGANWLVTTQEGKKIYFAMYQKNKE